jgi:uncharacterized repeat protein (TIGR03803 family)
MKKLTLILLLVFGLYRIAVCQNEASLNTCYIVTNGYNTSGTLLKPSLFNDQIIHPQSLPNAEAVPQFIQLTLFGNKYYGITERGGLNNLGTLFEFDPSTGLIIKKIDFAGQGNGGHPSGLLIVLGTKLYGMTRYGGSYNLGTLFEYNPATNKIIKKIDFNGDLNGAYPSGSLTSLDNKLIGMAEKGGNNGMGTLFEFNTGNETLIKKVDFNGASNGAYPYGSLTRYGDKFYGMTSYGGIQNDGTLFEYNPATSEILKKAEFSNVQFGRNPMGSLTLVGSKLFGLTYMGGVYGKGILFVYDPSITGSKLIKEVDFNSDLIGSYPIASLIQNSTNTLLGMTTMAGECNLGGIFEYSLADKTLTKKFDYQGISASKAITSQLIINQATQAQNNAAISTQIYNTSGLNVIVYPNPSSGDFSIVADGEIESITLINSLGQSEVFNAAQIHTSFKGLIIMQVKTNKGVLIKKLEVAN